MMRPEPVGLRPKQPWQWPQEGFGQESRKPCGGFGAKKEDKEATRISWVIDVDSMWT